MAADAIPKPHGIMFHYFHGGKHQPTQGSLSADQLEAIIQRLGRKNILSAQDFFNRALDNTLPNTAICFTFDDTLTSECDVAYPVLQRHGITAFWFVNTCIFAGQPMNVELYRYFRNHYFESIDEFYQEFFKTVSPQFETELKDFDPDSYLAQFSFYTKDDRKFRYLRDVLLGQQQYEQVMDKMIAARAINVNDLFEVLWLNKDDLKKLQAEGNIIGMHSHTHPMVMASLSVEQQHYEYRENKAILERMGIIVETMSHPSNSYNAETLTVLKKLGIQLGFIANMDNRPSLLELPRQDCADLVKNL